MQRSLVERDRCESARVPSAFVCKQGMPLRAAQSSQKKRKERTEKKTAGCAVGGALVLGTAGGAAATCTGAAMGAAAGVLPALFTFGLSNPVGAAVGGGMGMPIGSAAGALQALLLVEPPVLIAAKLPRVSRTCTAVPAAPFHP